MIDALNGADGEPDGVIDTALAIISRYGEVALYIASLVWLITLVYVSVDWRHWDRLFPILIGSITIALLAVQLLRRLSPRADQAMQDIVRPDSATADQPSQSDDIARQLRESKQTDRSPMEYRRDAVGSSIWIVGFGILIYYVGYVYAIPLFLFAFSLYAYRDWKMPVVITVATSVALYLVFVEFLSIFIWEGVLDLPLPDWLS